MITKELLKAFKPFPLISQLATYLLGAGLVQYVREMRHWSVFIQGGLFLLLITLSFEYLVLLQRLNDVTKWPEKMTLKVVKQLRLLIAGITATLLTTATSIFVVWMVNGVLWQGLILLVIAYMAAGIVYYLSKVFESLKNSQIFVEVLIFVILPPATAYFLQSSNLHRLLTLVVLGLVPAYLAYRILILLKNFGRDDHLNRQTMVTQMGWDKAMVFHNALILMTFLMFAITVAFGFPWFLLWPVFLVLPIGLMEIWLMELVRRGRKPLWKVMLFATASVYFFPIYLLGFALWTR